MSALREKSFAFAIRIVKLSQYLQADKKEYVLAKQALRSGTAIGALVSEAEFGQSKSDFVNKLSIALKEANETKYWLSLLKETNLLTEKMHRSLETDCNALIAILVTSVKTAKSRNTK